MNNLNLQGRMANQFEIAKALYAANRLTLSMGLDRQKLEAYLNQTQVLFECAGGKVEVGYDQCGGAGPMLSTEDGTQIP